MTLKEARRAKHLTQAQLADLANVPQQEISRLEAGQIKEPRHRAVMRLCRALDVEPSEIAEFHDGGSR